MTPQSRATAEEDMGPQAVMQGRILVQTRSREKAIPPCSGLAVSTQAFRNVELSVLGLSFGGTCSQLAYRAPKFTVESLNAKALGKLSLIPWAER